jgi:hypothetical protein
MSRDSGSERAQRTVAELLAEYGGGNGDAPRRRRRRADDDENSAPQTIIERVLSDSGKLLPIRDDQEPEPPRGRRGGGEHRPAGPPPNQPRTQPPAPPPTGYGEPVRPPVAPQQPAQQLASRPAMPPTSPPPMPPSRPGIPVSQPPSRPGMSPVGPPTTALRPMPQAVPQPNPQASRPAMKPVGPPTQQPPMSRPGMNPAGRPPAGPPPMSGRPPAGPLDDNLATAVHPPLPDDYAPTVMQARLAGTPPEATTEEFPLVPPTQVVAPVTSAPARRPAAPQPPMESTQAHPGPYVDEFEDSGSRQNLFSDADADFNPSRREDFDSADDFDERPGRDGVDRIDAPDDDDEDAESLSPGREWLLMGAQVGAGAIAGAAVFLAFSWLWGFQPIVAVLAALAVIVGLVFGVRRWRRADDLQTTVLAVLAGLVVTVSPAALLLVRR